MAKPKHDPQVPQRMQKLGALFHGYVTHEKRTGKYMIESPGDFPAVALVEAAQILGCKPDELFTSLDTQSDGGCETCAGPDMPVLVLEVRRAD